MKKFITKACFFIIPFISLFILNTLLYNQQEGDLIRIGFIYSNPTPKTMINNNYHLSKCYTLLSEIDLRKENNFDIITLGDSFSEQDTLGYKNFICHEGFKVLHVDRFISGRNPMETLIRLLNSDLFNNLTADYIILQSVEREFNERNNKIEWDITLNTDTLVKQIDNYKKIIPNYTLKFFSDATLRIPITNLQYSYEPKPDYSKTYRYKSSRNDLFSNSPNDLLFYQEEIINLNVKNDSLNILKGIRVIEALSDKAAKHKLKLIMLVSPDKYDLYFNFIEDKEELCKPRFFDIYDKTKKNYLNVDSYQILYENIQSGWDIYFYDDTHWSPKGAEIIANEITEIIRKDISKTFN